MAINKRAIQEVNAGSMADIAFLLLIFFLVATTMNSDQGLNRLLPPYDPEMEKVDILERNVLQVFVNSNDLIMVDQAITPLSKLGPIVKEFIQNRAGSPNLPEIEMKEIAGIGLHPVSKGIVSLQNDRGTSYDMYINVQNELTRAFNEIRNETAMRLFGRGYAELGKDQQKAIQEAVPLKVSEAEPYVKKGER